MNAPMVAPRQLRPIEPPTVDGPRAAVSERPELVLARPTDCRIDPAYQRAVTARGRKLIAQLVARWDWDRYDPIKVAEAPGGLWEVPDGQHRVAAALALGIDLLPALRVKGCDRAALARLFVDLNETRVTVTPGARFKAAVASGDPAALTVAEAARAAGVRIPYGTPPGGWRRGDCVAVSRLLRMNRSALAVALEACVAADLRPIRAEHLAALDCLLTGEEWRDDIPTTDALAAALRSWDAVKDDGDIMALDAGLPKTRARAAALFRRAQKAT